MPESLKVRKIGNSLGLILPQPVLEELKVKEGDELFMVRTPEGLRLTWLNLGTAPTYTAVWQM